jgi:hypothetical protein
MAAIEFEAIINDGSIVVPEEYRNRLKGQVRVRIVGEEKQSDGKLIDELLAQPLTIADFRPLTRDEIYARD